MKKLLCAVAFTMAAAVPAGAHSQQYGLASYYGSGRYTASGERFHRAAFTAAHRHLPFGTLVRVVNRRNGRSVVVRINDRGPFRRGRIIDLTPPGFAKIGNRKRGVMSVRLEVGLTVGEISSAAKKLDRVQAARDEHRRRPKEQELAEAEEDEHDHSYASYAGVDEAGLSSPLSIITAPLNIFTRFIESLLRPVGNCWEWEKVDQRVRTVWTDAARHFGGTVMMTSCYRSAAYNRMIYARRGRRPTRSMHILHKAIDGQITGVSSAMLAAYVRRHPIMMTIGGVGRYAGTNMVHVDCGPKRSWFWGGPRKKRKRRG